MAKWEFNEKKYLFLKYASFQNLSVSANVDQLLYNKSFRTHAKRLNDMCADYTEFSNWFFAVALIVKKKTFQK